MRTLPFVIIVGLAAPGFAADPPKPGSAEWKQRFRELEQRAGELQRLSNSGKSGAKSPKPGTAAWDRQFRDLERRLNSNNSTSRRGGTRDNAFDRKIVPFDERMRAKMTPDLRRTYDAAANPKPLDEDKAPQAQKCLLMFRDALNKGEEFGVLLQCLAPWRRQDWVMRQVNPNHLRFGQTEREFMADWRRVVGHVERIDSARKVSGVEGTVDVWAWVEAPGLSPGMYRFRMIGEGRFYRVSEYRADYVRVK